MKKTALITGITGQDGSYLSEFLLDKGYNVYGMFRRSSTDGHFERIKHLWGKVEFVCGDLTDSYSLRKIVDSIKPDEIYNLGAQSQVRLSFDQPTLTYEINWLGLERLLDTVKEYSPETKLYQASTSELFGEVKETPQSEKTPFNPVSPYSKSKLKAHEAIIRERERGLYACAGILFNHESPRRGLEFITRKFTDGIARIKLSLPQRETGKDYLEMGNLEALRDWGHAKDYVEVMWLMLQQENPKEYVISTGISHSVREFIELAANYSGIKINWEGNGIDEVGYDEKNKKIISINKNLFRPVEVHSLRGDPTRAMEELGWKRKISFEQLVEEMVKSDLDKLKKIL